MAPAIPLPLRPGVFSSTFASLSCALYTVAYVGIFYLFKDTRTGRSLSKNTPKVILSRFKSVTLVSVLVPLYVWGAVSWYGGFHGQSLFLQFKTLLLHLGVRPLLLDITLVNVLTLPLLHVAILFLGPLMLDWFERNLPFQRNFDFQVDVIKEITSLVGLRNFIVAPITEEFIFRACIVSTLYLGGFSTLAIILISPLYFGIAHVHHGWEIYHTYGETSYALKQALFTMGFQFLYTSLFGWYATYSFMRTGLLLPVILQHAFCNVMGFPDMSNVKRHPGWARIVIWTSLVLGAVGFTWTWFSLLNPKLFGGSLYW